MAALPPAQRAGYVYVRAEYPIAVEHLKIATAQASDLGLLGENILGSGLTFDLKIKEGAGAFVCGEETALIASIEGRRGTPRPAPLPRRRRVSGESRRTSTTSRPLRISRSYHPERSGLVCGDGYRSRARGRRYSPCGPHQQHGPRGGTYGLAAARGHLFKVGGGIPRGRQFKAVQMGGPSGGCVPMSHLNLPIDYGSLDRSAPSWDRAAMVVMDQNTCMVDVARFFLSFTQTESCGKCVPVPDRHETHAGDPDKDHRRRWPGRGHRAAPEEMGQSIKDASLCGLGQTAANPVLSTIRHFRDEYEAHIR